MLSFWWSCVFLLITFVTYDCPLGRFRTKSRHCSLSSAHRASTLTWQSVVQPMRRRFAPMPLAELIGVALWVSSQWNRSFCGFIGWQSEHVYKHTPSCTRWDDIGNGSVYGGSCEITCGQWMPMIWRRWRRWHCDLALPTLVVPMCHVVHQHEHNERSIQL